MSNSIPVIVNQSSIDNGRIYIDQEYKSFFGNIQFGSREATNKGTNVVIEANGTKYEGDIRISSGAKISPRKSFKTYLSAIEAKADDSFQLSKISDGHYRLDRTTK
jgi:hypothetical protein